jgi:hypothetical protein
VHVTAALGDQMNDPVTDEVRRHLSQAIDIFLPYALASGPINKQNAETVDSGQRPSIFRGPIGRLEGYRDDAGNVDYMASATRSGLLGD